MARSRAHEPARRFAFDGSRARRGAERGALADYAIECGATGILYTCSAFGDAIPNEAMFEEALRLGNRLGLLATFAASIPSMHAEMPGVALESICVPEAMAALQAGDGARHDALLAAAAPRLRGCDAIMLAQFSTARARDAVVRAVTCPVLTSPDSAVLAMRKRLI